MVVENSTKDTTSTTTRSELLSKILESKLRAVPADTSHMHHFIIPPEFVPLRMSFPVHFP